MNFEVIFHSLFPTLGIEATWTSKKSFPYKTCMETPFRGGRGAVVFEGVRAHGVIGVC